MFIIDFEKFIFRSWEKIGIQGKNKTGLNVIQLLQSKMLCIGIYLMMKYLNIFIIRCLFSKVGVFECLFKFYIFLV